MKHPDPDPFYFYCITCWARETDTHGPMVAELAKAHKRANMDHDVRFGNGGTAGKVGDAFLRRDFEKVQATGRPEG